jgi:hypothetical protein
MIQFIMPRAGAPMGNLEAKPALGWIVQILAGAARITFRRVPGLIPPGDRALAIIFKIAPQSTFRGVGGILGAPPWRFGGFKRDLGACRGNWVAAEPLKCGIFLKYA